MLAVIALLFLPATVGLGVDDAGCCLGLFLLPVTAGLVSLLLQAFRHLLLLNKESEALNQNSL